MRVTCSCGTSRSIGVSLHLVIFHSDLYRVSVCSPRIESGIIIIGSEHAYFILDSRFSHLLGKFRSRIRNSHRKSEFQRVGEFDPFLDITAVDGVRIGRKVVCTVRHESLYSSIKFLEHCLIDIFLGIVRYRKTSVLSDLSVRNRAVSIRNSVHCSNLDNITDRKDYRIVSYLM